MKHIFSFGALLAVCAPHLAISQSAREAVIAAETSFASQAASAGTASAFMACAAAGAVVVDNGRAASVPSVWGPRAQQPGTRLSWRPVLADVAQSGELGYTTGPWEFSKKGETMASGDYVTVWRKQANGAWKFAIDMGIEHGGVHQAPADVLRPQQFAAGATPVAVPSDAILDLDQRFASAELHAPVKTYQAYLSSEGRLYRPGQQPLLGATAHAVLPALGRAYLFATTGGYMAASGDLGYVYGTLRRPGSSPKQPDETGTYLRIWRREAKDGWRIVLEVLNVSSPTMPSTVPAGESPLASPTRQAPGRQ